MRLIDADKFKRKINLLKVLNGTVKLSEDYEKGQEETFKLILEFLDKQPTAYDCDKVMDRIKQHIATAEKVIVKSPHDEFDRIANETAEAFITAYQEVLRIMLEVPDDSDELSQL